MDVLRARPRSPMQVSMAASLLVTSMFLQQTRAAIGACKAARCVASP